MSEQLLITPSFTDDQLRQLAKLTDQFEWAIDGLRNNTKPVSPAALQAIGRILWDGSRLDPDQLAEQLQQAKDDDTPLRLIVSHDQTQVPDGETETDKQTLPRQFWPWEVLYHEHPRLGFLGQHPWCVITRREDGSGTKQPTCLPGPLRLLLFVASPEDLDAERARLDYEGETERLYTALDPHVSSGDVDIDVAEDGCLSTLRSRLQKNVYHAVILSLHGCPAVNRHGQSEWGLLFEDQDTGRKSPVAGSELQREFEELPRNRRPPMVVLAACRSAKLEETGASIDSVAVKLHQAGVERVVGMRLSILDKAASEFTAQFFSRLATGLPVGRALSLTRRKLATGEYWLADARVREAGVSLDSDPFAQWSLPVLIDLTTDGPLLDVDAPVTERPPAPIPELMPGDGRLSMPQRSAVIGRRAEMRRHWRDFFEGRHRKLLFTGPGGVGKTTLAGLFARILCERQPNTRVLGFQFDPVALREAPFSLENVESVLQQEAFDGTESPELIKRIQAQPDRRLRVQSLLRDLDARSERPALIVLDNLESLQDIRSLEFLPEHADGVWLVDAVCRLPQSRVLFTGRYDLSSHHAPRDEARSQHEFTTSQTAEARPHATSKPFPQTESSPTRGPSSHGPHHAERDGYLVCPIADASYGDVIQRMSRLTWPAEWTSPQKRELYRILGGNHRALEWLSDISLKQTAAQTQALVDELADVEPESGLPQQALDAVLEQMRQNLLLDRLLASLPESAAELLRRTARYRVPVSSDGLTAVYGLLVDQPDRASGRLSEDDAPEPRASARRLTSDQHTDTAVLLSRSLLERAEDHAAGQTKYFVPPIVRELLALSAEPSTADRGVGQAVPDDASGLVSDVGQAVAADASHPDEPCHAQHDLRELHRRMARHHEFQGQHVSRIWADDVEAIHHYRLAECHEDADRLGQLVANAFYQQSSFRAVLGITTQIVSRQSPNPPWWALNRHGMCQLVIGELDESLHSYERALAVAPDQESEAATLNNISEVYERRGKLDDALRFLKRSLACTRDIGDKHGEAAVINNMATLAFRDRDDALAMRLYKECLQLRGLIGDLAGKAVTLNNMSQIHEKRGDDQAAQKCLSESLLIHRQLGDRAGEATTLNNMATNAHRCGDYELSKRCLERCIQIQQEIGDRVSQGRTLNNLGQLHLESGDSAAAQLFLKQSLKISTEIGDKDGQAKTLNNIGMSDWDSGDADLALQHLEQAVQIYRDTEDPGGAALSLFNMGHIALESEDGERAMQCWLESLQLAQACGRADILYHSSALLGKRAAQQPDSHDQARQLLGIAADVVQNTNIEDTKGVLQTLASLK